MGLSNQQRQGGAVVPGRLAGVLGQDQLPLHINHSQPFQPVPRQNSIQTELTVFSLR